MTVTLINTSGRIKCVTLPHEIYCKALGRCVCTMTPGRNARRIPTSLTLAAGARLELVDEAVLAVPEIANAVRAGEMRVERTPIVATTAHGSTSKRQSGKKARGAA